MEELSLRQRILFLHGTGFSASVTLQRWLEAAVFTVAIIVEW